MNEQIFASLVELSLPANHDKQATNLLRQGAGAAKDFLGRKVWNPMLQSIGRHIHPGQEPTGRTQRLLQSLYGRGTNVDVPSQRVSRYMDPARQAPIQGATAAERRAGRTKRGLEKLYESAGSRVVEGGLRHPATMIAGGVGGVGAAGYGASRLFGGGGGGDRPAPYMGAHNNTFDPRTLSSGSGVDPRMLRM